jgi:hypothetical protein
MMTVIYLLLGLATFAALIGFTNAVDRWEKD